MAMAGRWPAQPPPTLASVRTQSKRRVGRGSAQQSNFTSFVFDIHKPYPTDVTVAQKFYGSSGGGNGFLYISRNYGQTWDLIPNTMLGNWNAVATDYNGTMWIAATFEVSSAGQGTIYRSP